VDLGCGDGTFVRLLRDAGYRDVVGVDASAEQVEAARVSGVVGIEHCDLLDYSRKSATASVAAIITWDVIEHLLKDETLDLAEEVGRVLMSGGCWIIHVPNAESPFFGRVRYGDWTHEQAFTRTSIEQLLRAVGIDNITCEEDRPPVHGVTSAIRLLLWHVFRSVLRLYLAAETGDVSSRPILSQNLTAIGRKA
jgi:cyclopropane fatty-acyl-phospholipid synthase-like methyltransferase